MASHSQALKHDSDSRSLSGAELSRAGRATPPAELGDDDALQAIAEGTAQSTGAEFFRKLVQHLARALGVEYAMVAEFAGENRVRTLAYWKQGLIAENVEYDLPGTPCEEVVRGNLCHHPSGVARQFPQDVPLTEMAIESYLGVPLVAPDGSHLGHLCVFDRRPMPAVPQQLLIFKIFAARAGVELERLRIEHSLIESEQRYRDLFEEAPIAYVLEDIDSRFIKANQAAIRILGLKPEEVAGTLGMSLVAETPENQRRIREAFASVGQGASAGGFVVELRRKDNGNPVWVQWWSKPEPDGKYTRTMIVDITERVLMEQEQARLRAQNLYLQEEIKADHNFEEIVGQSVPLLHVLENVLRVAPTDASVLISGETGTGKELIARAIHSNSKRRDRPLIKVNCAALPTGLVESELFGHEKGAFTGAISRRIGRFELADGGTIFLDEIGEIPLEVQVKLLRVLQEREFDRVGGGKSPISVDVRVIAATNRDLLSAVREKTFREDLYYRLNVFPLRLPPLRERKSDIPLLAHFLVKKYATSIGKSIARISAEALVRLDAYDWPGNVRELENIIERAVILAPGPVLDIDPDVFVPRAVGSQFGDGEQSSPSLEDVERAHICKVLDESSWIIEGPKGAARVLGLHPNTLRSRLKKLGIARPPLASSHGATDGAPTRDF
ncbi:MAG TPA: sigma 54-interacting transcriptional regulator [Planctomycetaceae bacterium]|nr:sigma 54-interacting transcriptional regulator [Planctomycetaceae bacterium]